MHPSCGEAQISIISLMCHNFRSYFIVNCWINQMKYRAILLNFIKVFIFIFTEL